MAKVILVLGGARSGKSGFAMRLAEGSGVRNVAFIATGQGLDAEMRRRIVKHKAQRPGHWRTFEEPRKIAALVKKIAGKHDFIIIDCLTLFVSNHLLKRGTETTILKELNAAIAAVRKTSATCVIVSNEVGLGIVPENKLARDFRDVAGRVNQAAAAAADEAFFTVSGIPWRIK